MTTDNDAETLTIRFGRTNWQIPRSGADSIRSPLQPLDDLNEAVDAALSQPLDFASIDQMIVPGDTVAIAVDPNIPSLPQVVAAVSQWLVEHGTAVTNLQVILPGTEDGVTSLAAHLSRFGMKDVQVIRHDPDDVNSVSYVAADEEAHAIYINRAIVDADVVIPLMCARSSDAIDYLGSFGIFAHFSNRDILGQLHCYWRLANYSAHQHLIDRSNQAAWWLGVMVAIQVVPAENDQVAGILCGAIDKVDQAVRTRLNEFDRADFGESDLVVACVDGDAQNWSNLARALHAAIGFCSSGGSIVICSELSDAVGPALKRLRDSQSSREQIEKRLSKDNTDDALAAGAILEATRDRHVYLVSNHRGQTVESLGMAALADQQQLTHLIRQHARYVVLHSAQHTLVTRNDILKGA